MKTTAQHAHADGTICWWDFGQALEGWWTQLPEDYEEDTKEGELPQFFPTQNVPCPNPTERGLVEIGSRDEPLVSGDAPYSPPKQKPAPRATKRKAASHDR